MKPEERIKNVQHALNNYFDSEPAPTPSEAKAFLLKLRQDIDIMARRMAKQIISSFNKQN